jgi:hypothetical protein
MSYLVAFSFFLLIHLSQNSATCEINASYKLGLP